MVGDFLDRLGGDFAQCLIARLRERRVEKMLECRDQQMARDGPGEIAIGLLDQQAIAVIEHVAVECERVGVSPRAFRLARRREQQGCLADLVEREVGEAQIDLDRRRVAAPFAEPLPEDQRVVAQPQQIVETRRIGPADALLDIFLNHRKRRHQICVTSSGTS